MKLPHDKNPLGKVKYLFPNPHAVYVHDTPYQQWFNEPVRAASHGCIRLEDPFSLAKLIAEEQGVESLMDNVISARDLRESKTFHLKEPLPIHLVYWTAWADESEEKMHYLLCCFARKVQFPHIKLEKFIVAYSRIEGTGKSSIFGVKISRP